jgi:hypothetical protein
MFFSLVQPTTMAGARFLPVVDQAIALDDAMKIRKVLPNSVYFIPDS